MDDQLIQISRAACYAALEVAWELDAEPEESDLVDVALNITMLSGQGMQLQSIIEQIEGRGIAADGFRGILAELERVLNARIAEAAHMIALEDAPHVARAH